MKAKTIKAVTGMVSVVMVASVFFVYGCNQGDLYPLIGALLILAGKETAETYGLLGMDSTGDNNE